MEQQLIPGDNPVAGSGTYLAQFNNIRQTVLGNLQKLGADYAMSVQRLVKTCLGSNLEMHNLAALHCKYIADAFKTSSVQILNHTNSNALLSVDDKDILVTFDLSNAKQSIITAERLQPAKFTGQFDLQSEQLLLKQLQVLMLRPIDEANIVIPYEQVVNNVVLAKAKLHDDKITLQENIRARAFTAFEFKPGMSLYTLNYSDDMSMLFWDRYTIVDATMKSYYIEQHCIVEHTISGDVEPERFIDLHKPSKNSMAGFLADRLVCLLDMSRPVATVDEAKSEVPHKVVVDAEEDEPYTDDELRAMGVDPEDCFSTEDLMQMRNGE